MVLVSVLYAAIVAGYAINVGHAAHETAHLAS
jgi:hypothetical protein